MKEIDQLNKNVNIALQLSKELYDLTNQKSTEKALINKSIESLKKRLVFINNATPYLLQKINLAQPLINNTEKINNQNLEQPKIDKNPNFFLTEQTTLHHKDKKNYLKELNISSDLLRKIKKHDKKKEEKVIELRSSGIYGKIANKIFLKLAEKNLAQGKFKNLSLDLRRSNLNILSVTYLSMMYFSTILSVLISIILIIFLNFYSISITFPFINTFNGEFLIRFTQTFWLIFAIPILVFTAFYFYPGTEKKSLAHRINQELPFLVIHMASVSGGGIEPGQIFKIVGLSKEYKYTGTEIRKILNEINIYGYDLTTALRNIATVTPSEKLAELLNGISITINSGGELKTFFEKRAESLLLDYRLEREKFTKTAETFMDIYISIVIAAPMILLMLLIMISVSRISIGLSVTQLTIAIIGMVAILNVLFLTFLQLKQPNY